MSFLNFLANTFLDVHSKWKHFIRPYIWITCRQSNIVRFHLFYKLKCISTSNLILYVQPNSWWSLLSFSKLFKLFFIAYFLEHYGKNVLVYRTPIKALRYWVSHFLFGIWCFPGIFWYKFAFLRFFVILKMCFWNLFFF